MKAMPRPVSGGFTLIELMVAMAIIVVLAMVAIPSFVTFQRNSQLTSLANALQASINTARGEALKRNQTAFVVPLSGTDWTQGWQVFVSRPGYNASTGVMTSIASDGSAQVGSSKSAASATYSASQDLLVQTVPALPSYLSISVVSSNPSNAGTAISAIRLDGSGYSRPSDNGSGFQSLTFQLKRNDVGSGQQPSETRILIVAQTGRTRTCKPQSSNDASCKVTLTQ
jgi:type IV fimbrial biogenesis protein FimT